MAEYVYELNEHTRRHEWAIYMHGKRLCCAVDESVARQTCRELNEMRFG